MVQTLKKTYQEGRKASKLDPQKQKEIRENILERTQVNSDENIEKLKIQGSLLTEKRKHLAEVAERLSLGRPIEAHRQNKTMGVVFLLLFLGFLASEFFLLQWTFRPFGLGTESFIISFGLMLAGVTAIEEYLRSLHSRNPSVYSKWVLWLVFFSVICFIVSWILLSNARAALISSSAPVQGLEAQIETADNFYARTSFIYIAIALASLAIAFMGGVVLHEGINRLLVSGPILSVTKKLRLAESSLAQTSIRIKAYEAMPKKLVSEFDRGILDGPPSSENRMLSPLMMVIISLAMLLLIATFVRGEETINESVIVLFDLSGSSQEKNFLDETEFQKNTLFVEEIIKNLRPGAYLRIVGITDKSFDRHYIILNSKIPKVEGYFSEKLAKEKLAVLKKWKQTVLVPNSKSTDVFGALLLSSILFEKEFKNKKLIILSDLRNSSVIDMEALPIIDESLLRKIEEKGIIADLTGVQVWALGVSTANKTYQYWDSLKAFWEGYFERSGASLVSFSLERKWDSKLINGNGKSQRRIK